MKDTLYRMLEQTADLTFEQIILQIFVAAIIGLFIFISYCISHSGTIYSKKFGVSLMILTVLTSMVMTVIGNNVALSLGMVGALSIVRFRTAIKDTRDTVYIFWTIIVGICCGVGDFLVAGIGSTMVFIILFILGCIKNDLRMLLVIRASRQNERNIEKIVFEYFDRKANLKVKNTTKENIEFIYELSKSMLDKSNMINEDTIIESLYKLKNVDYVNIVSQNDEING